MHLSCIYFFIDTYFVTCNLESKYRLTLPSIEVDGVMKPDTWLPDHPMFRSTDN